MGVNANVGMEEEEPDVVEPAAPAAGGMSAEV